MNAITLTIGETTQSIQDWGFTYATLHLRNRTPSTLILDMAGALPESGTSIDYGAQIVAAFALGDGSNYTFVGRRRKFNGRAHPDAPATSLQFEDVLRDLDLTIFQHYWSMSNGEGGVENKYFSRINLFQDISAGPDELWTYLTADNQLRQIVDYAGSPCDLNVQYGTVDPVWNMPIIAMRAVSCLGAIQQVLKPMPDMVIGIDYSTVVDGTPTPTLNFLQRKNCTPVTLPYAGTDVHGRNHVQSEIMPRPDLQVPAVVIQYQIVTTVDGASYNSYAADSYPPAATGTGEGQLVVPIDLRGPSTSIVKATLKAVAIDPTSTTFWKTVKPDLNDPNIALQTGSDGSGLGAQGFAIVDTTVNADSGHPDGITIIDGADEFVDISGDGTIYPNKLLPSGAPVATWMMGAGNGESGPGDVQIEGIPVTIRATLKYNVKNPTSGNLERQVDRQVVEARITLTDAPAGSTTYSTVGSYSAGDPSPEYLAYYMWCSINNAAVNYVDGVAVPPEDVPAITDPENFQWEGEHVIVEDNIYSIITPANTLNLSGGATDWETMNAVIYAVDIDLFQGKTTIQFGPFKHMQAAEFWEMLMTFKVRQIWDNSQLRNTGQAGSSGGADTGSAGMAKENVTEQPTQHSVHTASSPPSGGSVVIVQNDANTNGGQLVVQTVKSDGTTDTTLPQVQLSQSDLGTEEDGGDVGRVAKWRLIAMCDSSGSPMQAMFACSEPEDIT